MTRRACHFLKTIKLSYEGRPDGALFLRSSIPDHKHTKPIPTRFKQRSFSAFRLSALGGRQPARDRRDGNHLKYHPLEVRRSFAGADLCLHKAKAQSSLSGWSSILTKCRRKAARQNRVLIGSVCLTATYIPSCRDSAWRSPPHCRTRLSAS